VLTTKRVERLTTADNNPFCNDKCAKAGICAKCNKVLAYDAVAAMNRHWHPVCFHCGECGSVFQDNRYNTVQSRPGKPICDPCAESLKAIKFH
jgi:hypothetical protein